MAHRLVSERVSCVLRENPKTNQRGPDFGRDPSSHFTTDVVVSTRAHKGHRREDPVRSITNQAAEVRTTGDAHMLAHQHLLAAEGDTVGEDTLPCDAERLKSGNVVPVLDLGPGPSDGVSQRRLLTRVEYLELRGLVRRRLRSTTLGRELPCTCRDWVAPHITARPNSVTIYKKERTGTTHPTERMLA